MISPFSCFPSLPLRYCPSLPFFIPSFSLYAQSTTCRLYLCPHKPVTLIHTIYLVGLDTLLPHFLFISVPTLSAHRWHLFVWHGGAKSSVLRPWTRVKSAPSVKVTISARVANRLPSQTVSVWVCVRVYVCVWEWETLADCASKDIMMGKETCV